MKIALILTSGGTRGAFQVGVLKTFVKKNIIPNAIIATSIGTINGAKFSSTANFKKSVLELEKGWLKATSRQCFPIKLKLNSFNPSFYSIKGLRNLAHTLFSARKFEDLKIPFYVHCITQEQEKDVFFDKGNLIDPILASCSVRPYFPPYEFNGVRYIDGCSNKYFGIKKAISLGCDRAILVDSIPRKIGFNSENLDIILDDKAIKKFKEKVLIIEPSKKFNINRKNFRNISKMIEDGELQSKKILKNFL
ncbi:MAG: patatin-like phospholipase family protein [Nanoarchaeota archaeon]|nr:patatin-like phospholipase family protein [Nanoarchaeota archaeon]